MSSLGSLNFPVATPSRGSKPMPTTDVTTPVPSMSAQMGDRALWGFLVVGVAICAVVIYLFTQAENDASGTAIATQGGLSLTDNVPVVSIVGCVAILASAYASYRAYKSFEGDPEVTAKRGYVLVLFALNMFLTAVWTNQYYAHADSETQTSTTVALGIALTSGLLASSFWQKDRVAASMAALNCVVALVGAYCSYYLVQA